MTKTLVLSTNCKGPNPACRAANKMGRPVHVTPPMGSGLILPTYHFETADQGIKAVEAAMATAPVVMNDEDLYRYRAEGVAHYLSKGWIDPTCR